MNVAVYVLMLTTLVLCGCTPESSHPHFTRVRAQDSHLTFANRITEDDTFNILAFEYVYNGGGVGAADFDGDGRTDLYFTGNTTENRLFLNRGDMQFEDVTESAGVSGRGRWCGGVSIADVNGDEQPDIYVSATAYQPGYRRANLLYLNEGIVDGHLRFREVARESGIADTSHTTQSAWLDYDRDGDLDLYVLVNEMHDLNIPNRYLPKITDGTGPKNDKLYRNDGLGDDGLPHFTDVTRQASILKEGYGLGVSVCDVNHDGWPDLYVTNDYLSNDLLWINQGDGTFEDRADDYFKHTSYSAMGNDVADLNGDGLDDLVAVDMFPEDNYRRKTMMPPHNYHAYLNNERYGYLPQFTRNTLQLQQPVNDTLRLFSDMGMMAGVAATDWSWSPLAVDVDHDGDRDLLITNGFPRDVTDRDFMDYNVQVAQLASREMRLREIPSVKIANYAYENDGADIPYFYKRSREWGLDIPSFSNGAAYADLDNDGDLDYVVNNINDSCLLWRNDLVDHDSTHWLRLRLRGGGMNTAALGARVVVDYGGRRQTAYNAPVRGFLSSVSDVLHFGLGGGTDSLATVWVAWPDGDTYIYKDVRVDRVTEFRPTDGSPAPLPSRTTPRAEPLVMEANDVLDVLPPHRDRLFIDFNVQPLLPHQLSEYGPGLAVADVNGDGLDDLYRSGSHFYKGQLLLQRKSQAGASFELAPSPSPSADSEELGSLFFDADGDGDQDLYLVGGGSAYTVDRPELIDKLLLNDGTGNFRPAEGALPEMPISGSCVRAADVDRDGDQDLFVGGRLSPGRFPEPVNSYLLVNDGQGNFSDRSPAVLERFGMVTDALWSDYDSDGWPDLLIVGQGMPLRVFQNREGLLVEATPPALADRVGWWNSLAAADFDGDGDIDYAAGNLGTNNLYARPEGDFVGLYGADFDGNGGYDLLLSSLAPASGETDETEEFPHFQRTDTEKQIIKVKQLYPRHADFGAVRMNELLANFPEAEVTSLRANYLRSAWIENVGDGEFALHELPRQAQVAPLFGLVATDVNADGYPDLLAVGNDYGAETGTGMFDGLNGLVLLFDVETGNFRAAGWDEQRFFVPGNGRSLTLMTFGGEPLLIAAENNGPTRAFRLPVAGRQLR